MIRDNEAENMTASEWRVRNPQSHPMPPTRLEQNIGWLFMLGVSFVAGMVSGGLLVYGYLGSVR